MSRWSILLDKYLLKHVAIIAGSAVLLLVLVFFLLRLYTLHGQSQPVPDFTGLTETQFHPLVESRNLRYVIIDSVHFNHMPRGVVVEQVPRPGEQVKRNRRIFITINSWTEEQVPMPNLIDYSVRNAKVILESMGLGVGTLTYVPSEYTNLVLGQRIGRNMVVAGELVPKGTNVDLLVGSGLSSETTNVPDLTGLRLRDAQQVAQSSFLNTGAIIYDLTIKTMADSLNAFVWRQAPAANQGQLLRLGASIDIWLTIDETLLLQEVHPVDGQVIGEVDEELF